MTPPAVSRPSDNGATSSSNRSCSFEDDSLPLRIAACTVAPYATASSGLMDLNSSFPLNKSFSNCCTFERSSNRARVMVELKSTPSNSESISMYACAEVDNVRLARSHAVRRRRRARWFDVISLRCLRLNSVTKNSTRRLSKSSPPKCVSPAVALTSKIPSSIVSSETSNVPLSRSKISTLCSPPFLSSP
ncbi:uncharacterized protein PITG_18939 [Phytophthora infestans T30-4]|uniref:Uncharacterized protein n=1 Tax=Phytophthora infestans (strain T30-4) TaxID=403677 RepID=D0P023_PHYIT|nr:uncharacterized protein PITG_18939 [Phytophthora infestans T30-4]EEY70183.1 conserved hypothetical protein [Phytophthora infestans T30-4]|eukprot:XP_002997044.1 conserved hypothetical protein [Phytophthora infestans T30-4]